MNTKRRILLYAPTSTSQAGVATKYETLSEDRMKYLNSMKQARKVYGKDLELNAET